MTTTGPPPPNALMALIIEGRRAAERLEEELAALDLSQRRMGLLGHLRRHPGLSLTELAARARISVPAVRKVIAAMAEDGLVDAAGMTQGRAAEITVTPAGAERLRRATAVIERLDAESFGPAADPARRALGRALRETSEEQIGG